MSNTLTNPDKVVTEERLLDFYQGIFPYLGGMPEAVLINGDLPVGTIIYKDGLIVPEGWLLCDHSTKNISAYPDLANYFQTEHGKKNYYSGDGTNTFGLPWCCGMPEGRVHEGALEHIVDVDMDRKPIYEKTINLGSLPNNTNKTVSHGISNLSRVMSLVGNVTDGTYFGTIPLTTGAGTCGVFCDNSNIWVYTNYNTSAYTGYATIRYTKTTDSAVPFGYSADRKGIWIIKAKTMIAEDYSTTEKIVGTWIDGKYVYQKTFTGTMPSTADTALSIPIGASVSNVFVKNAMYKNANNVWFPFPDLRQDTYAGDAAIRIASSTAPSGANTIFLKCAVANAVYVITIQYTKTS